MNLVTLIFVSFGFVGAIVCFLVGMLRKGYARKRNRVNAIGMFLIGLTALVSDIIDNQLVFTLGISLAIAFIGIGNSIVRIIQMKKCVICIEATLSDVHIYRSYEKTRHTPVFSYSYDGKKYTSSNLIAYSKFRFNSKFVVGERYHIYINPEIPEDCTDRRFSWGPVFGTLALFLFAIVAIFSIITTL